MIEFLNNTKKREEKIKTRLRNIDTEKLQDIAVAINSEICSPSSDKLIEYISNELEARLSNVELQAFWNELNSACWN